MENQPRILTQDCERQHSHSQKTIGITIFLGAGGFEETFLILPALGMVPISKLLFEAESVILDVENPFVHLPDRFHAITR